MKTIEYTLSSSGINPADVQAGGVQGDHCATALLFQITQDLWQYIGANVPAGHNIRCHVETSDGTGGFHASDLLVMETKATGTVTPDTTVRTVTYIIPKEITLAGGVAQFFLVISDVDNDSLSSHILFSFPARVRFDASAAGTNSAENYYGDINGALDVFLKAFPIGTDKIQDAAVTGDKIADGAVDTEHLANYAVTTDKLAPVSVTTTRLADGAVDSAKIADWAIITDTIADGAVTPEKLASGYISTGYDGDLDDLKTPGMYKIVSNSSIDQHRPAGFDAMSLLVMDAGLLGGSQSYIQLAASGSGDDLYMRATAPGSGGAWSTWTNIREVVDGAITTGKIADGAVTRDKLGEDIFWNYVTADFNTLTDYGLYVVRAGGNAPTADASTYALIVISDGNTVQLAIPNSANPQLYMRSLAAGNWSEWQPLGGGVADGSVTTAKLADEAVAWDKVSGDMLSPVKQLTVDFAGANRAIPLSILPYKYIEGNIYTLSLEARLTNANANSISLGPMLTADSGDRYNWDSNSYLSLSADWQSVTLSGIQGIQSIGLFVYGPSDAVPTPEVEIRNLQLCDTFDTDVIDHVAFQASGLRAMDIDSPTVDWPDNYLLPSLDYVKSLLHGVEKQIVPASTSQAGLVQLNNTLTSTSTTEALTAAQGKALSDKIDAIPGGGTVGDGSITTAKLANGAVTADKLADAAVPAASTSQAGLVQLNNTLTSTSTTQALTAAQGKALSDKIDAMPGGGTVGDGSITTAKLADGAVTAEKLADDAIPDASTTQAGLVQLNNSLTSTSTTQALTAAQGKALNDKVVKYGTCSTTASTAAKTATISGFSLVSGALVVVRFTYGNTASSPTLNISSTGAKSIYRDGSSSDSLDLASGEAVLLVYDGTYYRVVDIPDASTTRAGKVQLNNTLTSTSTTQALTAAQGKALNDKIPDIEVESGNCTLRTNTGSKTSACKYYKVGKMVTVYGSLPNYDGSSTYVSGLPFTPAEEASTITGTGTQATEYYILYAVTNGRLFMRDAAVHAFYIEDQWKGQSFTLTYITDE